MRSNLMKLIAIVLATLFLFTAAACGVGLVYIMEFGLYEENEAGGDSFLEQMTYRLAWDYAQVELGKQLGGMEDWEAFLLSTHYVPEIVEDGVHEILLSHTDHRNKDIIAFQHSITDLIYPVVLEEDEEYPNKTYLYEETCRAWVDGGYQYYTVLYYPLEMSLDVTVFWQKTDNPWLTVAELCYTLREYLLPLMLLSLALFVVCMVYLCWAAGKKKGREEILPGGLNRIPLDLYALASVLACGFLLAAIFNGMLEVYEYYAMYTLSLILAVVLVLAVCLVPVCFIFAFAAQVKAKGYWWRRSVIGWCCIRLFRALRWCWRGAKAIFRMLPVIWQWLLTAAGMVLLPVILLMLSSVVHRSFYRQFFALMFLGSLALNVLIILYGGYCFGIILKAAKGMAAGDLERKLDTRYLYGSFRDCGENLNTVSQAAMVAARKQMQSERMKTELITNVSHDIKTPLTSIINYVDLLQKPHTEEENAEYLEVLARQSQRLKKLTEDLVEMSKASTGNVTVELTAVDAGEAVLQALGEFGDKLDAMPLSVVFPQPQEPVMMRADGRLSWRIMSNLLGNAVKYAMPGTRLYVNVERSGEWVVISFKNISRESLNISAEELMERFVRGDASRNTEGSGLGLNIARSLMEVQGGTLELTVDGDLFKVTLTFPAV